jgi:acyl-CoA thioesterase-2
MRDTTEMLLKTLDLEQLEVNLFRGLSPQVGWQRVFGGQVVAQALVAAAKTVSDETPIHSLHGYFLIGGDPKIPIIYEVDRIRDGRSYVTRRVNAIQHGRAIFSMSASFHAAEEGYDHQFAMPDVPMPEDLPDHKELRD